MKDNQSHLLSYSLWILLFCLIPQVAWGVDNAKLTKTVHKAYKVSKGANLEIINKYGDVIINSWSQDSVSISITVTAFGKNDEAAEKLIDRTDFHYSQVGDFISVFTQLDKSKGWIRDLWNELSDYSKSILSKDQLDIDYEVYLPDYVSLDLSNKFGDVYIGDRNIKTRLDISNGSLKADHLRGVTNLSLSFCQADIQSVQDASINLKSSELDLLSARNLKLESSSSTIFISEIADLNIISRTDKLSINQAGTVRGRGSFSKMRIKSFQKWLDLDMNYGNLTAEKIAPAFSKIDVTGKSTDIQLTFHHNAYFNTLIVAKEGKLDLPTGNKLKQVYTDGRERFIKASGHLGAINSTPADLHIDAQGGRVSLDFAPSSAHSQNE